MVTLDDRTVVTPAVVYARDDDSLVTGEAANRRAVSSPERVGREFKRRLGDPTPVMLGGAPHAVTSLLAALLKDTVAKVTETEGGPPANVVLTHPANWGPYRRELFEEVPQLAGLPQARMITEPEAAAAHYAAARHLGDGDTVAVYDLGGGTFDATVLRKRAGVNTAGIDILGSPEGIERLGGVDFDDAILAHINFSSGGALSELDLSNPQTGIALARLRQDCIAAKEALSVDTEAAIPVFLPNRHFDIRLTRGEFEDMIRAQIESTIGALTRTLRSARVEPADLSAVLLVGGSSRIPLVAQMITAALNRPTLVDAHPKYAVALGAATLAAELGTASRERCGRARRPDGRPGPGAGSGQRVPAGARRPPRGSAGTAPAAFTRRPSLTRRRSGARRRNRPGHGARAGWIGGGGPDSGPGTGPFAAVGTPTRSDPAPPRRRAALPVAVRAAVPRGGAAGGPAGAVRRTRAGQRPRRLAAAAGRPGSRHRLRCPAAAGRSPAARWPPGACPGRRSAAQAARAGHRSGGRGPRAARRRDHLRPPAPGLGPHRRSRAAPLPRTAPAARSAPDRAAALGGREPADPGGPRGDRGGQHPGVRRDRTQRHVRLRRQPRRRRRHRRRHRHRQGGRHDPDPGRASAVPRVLPRRLAALRQRVQRPGPLDQRGRRARHADQHGAHQDPGRHPAVRAGRASRTARRSTSRTTTRARCR